MHTFGRDLKWNPHIHMLISEGGHDSRTNKFINVSFEGVANPIYMDDPQQHKTDFTISPKWYTSDNMFINITTEKTTGTPIYNNSTGFKIVNTSIKYDNCEFKIKPQLFLGGVNGENSIETVLGLYKNLENVAIPNTPKYSIVNSGLNGFVSKYMSLSTKPVFLSLTVS